MSDQAKVRLVRCPKCDKLLPELEGYTVYQCGGCGAVLSAKTRGFEMESLSQNSGDETAQVVEENLYSKPDNYSITETKNFVAEGSNTDVRSHDSSSRRDEKPNEKLKAEKWVVDPETNETLNEFIHAGLEGKLKDSGSYNRSIVGSQRLESFADWRRGIDGYELDGFSGNEKQGFQALRYSTSVYQEDGPSNFSLRPSYGYGEPKHNRNGVKELSKVEHLEQDRAELLRKLEELKDQISRSCNISEKPKEKVPLDVAMARPEVTYLNKPSHANQYSEASPYLHENSTASYYDSLTSQIPRRASHHEPNQYYLGNYIPEKMDPCVQPYPKDMNRHHPHCSCVHCYNNHSRVAAPSVPPNGFRNKRLHEPYNPMLYRHENKSSFGPLDYNSTAMNSYPWGTHNPQPQTRWTSDLNSNVCGYDSRGPPRMAMTIRKRRWLPVSGGAPLVSCYNCFQLLELPKTIFPTRTSHVKLTCGACSTIILFKVVGKKLISAGVDANLTPNMVIKKPDLGLRRRNLHNHVRATQASTNCSSEDFDNSSYYFKFLDGEDRDFGSNGSENMRAFNSASSYSSENEVISDSMNPQEEGPYSAELQTKTVISLPLTGSPLEDHFDHSSKFRFEKGNQNGGSDREKTELRKDVLKQNSLKDACLATEMEVSFNGDTDTGTSLESGGRSKDEVQLKGNKGAQSFFAAIIKKSLKDLSKSNTTVDKNSTNVMINGHPMPYRLLKKAEKIAGPVHPGKYWYDNRAGFWGVIGGPCLGIIPPFIEEFDYPMSENCSGGNTSILVNGRELHQKDLYLLSSRGLPSTRDRSYIIEISGRVLDEDNGEELESLGKLAPTVEKVKHGFGMKVLRIAS